MVLYKLSISDTAYPPWESLQFVNVEEMKYKLATKGLDRKLIEEYIDNNYEELKEYEDRCIQKVKTKKAGATEEEIYQYLYRKGYMIEK